MHLKQNEQEESYVLFLEELKNRLVLQYPGKLTAQRNTVVKNNGISMQGILLCEEGSRLLPNFYLEGQYEEYKHHRKTMGEIAEYVLNCYEQEKKKTQSVLSRIDFEWESVREHVTFRLINKEKNKEMLKTSPYEEFLDLALVYQYTIQISSEVQGTAQITNEHFESFGITREELYETAKRNTKQLYPAVIYAIEDVIFGRKKEWDGEKIEPGVYPQLYVMTNRAGIHGAASLIYKDGLRKFAEAAGGGFYILPSSIHEVIFVPDRPDISLRCLADSVREINAERVEPTDVLSDQVYYYEPLPDCVRRLGRGCE